MQTTTDPLVFWSAFDTIVWIAFRSLEVVDRHFRSFEALRVYYSMPGSQGPRSLFSLEHACDAHFLPALNSGLTGVATEARMGLAIEGGVIVPVGPEQMGFSVGLGTWKTQFSYRGVLTSMGEVGTGEGLQTGMVELGIWERTLVLVWRAGQSESSVVVKYWLDAKFNKADVLARWPPLAEDEARRLAKEPTLTAPQGFGKTAPAWELHGKFIPNDVAIRFLAFGPRFSIDLLRGPGSEYPSNEPEREVYLSQLVDQIRASRAIRDAARDGHLVAHGRKGGIQARMEPIAATEFVTEMRLVANSYSDIARDELHLSYSFVLLNWTDVVIERQSFLEWIKDVSSRLQSRAKVRAVKEWVERLVQFRKEGPQDGPKSKYYALAREKNTDLTDGQLDRAWDKAAKEFPSPDWGKPGRPSKIKIAST